MIKTKIYSAFILFGLLIAANNMFSQYPDFIWAKSAGGTSSDKGVDIVTNANGDVFAIGNFSGTADFDPSSGVHNLTATGPEDIFILKLNSSGQFQWVKQLGSANEHHVTALVIDTFSNLYITGYFSGALDCDPGSGVNNIISTSLIEKDIFVCKYNLNGNLVWNKTMGGMDTKEPNAICLDKQRNVITTGFFEGTVDFDPSASNYNLSTTTNREIFISKLDENGNFVWAKQMGGGSDDIGFSVTTDKIGNVYSTGSFRGTADFNPASGSGNVSNLISGGSEDIYVSKLNSQGDFIWAKKIGGTNADIGRSIHIDTSGQIYLTGTFQGVVDFNPSTGSTNNLTSFGSNDCFLLKLGGNVGNYLWANQIGGTGSDAGVAIKIANSNDVYLAGYFFGTANVGSGTISSAGAEDIFMMKTHPDGSTDWTLRYGSSNSDIPGQLFIDKNENIYTTGFYNLTVDFDHSAGTGNLTSNGNSDVFVFKQNNCVKPWVYNITPAPNQVICQGSTTLSAWGTVGNIYWYASASSQTPIASGPDYSTPLLTTGIYDYFVADSSCSLSDKVQIQVTVNNCVGDIEYSSPNNKIIFFPNPFDSEFTVKSMLESKEPIRVIIMDYIGREVYRKEEIQPHSGFKINTAHLAPGVYILNVSAGNNAYCEKLIKQ